MTEQDLQLIRIQQEASLKREEIQADVKKVVYGTLLLGIAVALFPVISGFIEHYFNLRIENAKQVNALALQANQLELDVRKLERESELARESAKSATEQSDREFFEEISDEARSARLSDRITIAEFFSFVARDEGERERWELFLTHLKGVQKANNTRRSELLLIISDTERLQSDREAAARELAQIDERESGVASVVLKSKWLQNIPIPNAEAIGTGDLTNPTSEYLISVLGSPHSTPGNECQLPNNPTLTGLLSSRNVGPFSARLISPALDSLERILKDVLEKQPDLYKEVGVVSDTCVRFIRGNRVLTDHSWGIAIDITIGGELTAFGQIRVQAGLAELAKFFAKEGWVWGGHFSRPDAMHFAVSTEKLKDWEAAGLLTLQTVPPPN